MILVPEVMGELLSQEVERGGVGGDGGFVVMEGAYDGGARWDGGLGK